MLSTLLVPLKEPESEYVLLTEPFAVAVLVPSTSLLAVIENVAPDPLLLRATLPEQTTNTLPSSPEHDETEPLLATTTVPVPESVSSSDDVHVALRV